MGLGLPAGGAVQRSPAAREGSALPFHLTPRHTGLSPSSLQPQRLLLRSTTPWTSSLRVLLPFTTSNTSISSRAPVALPFFAGALSFVGGLAGA